MDAFDEAVLGGGIGGCTVAAKLAQCGLVTALAEQDKVGGACLRRGRVPIKLLLEAAETISLIVQGARTGIEVDVLHLDCVLWTVGSR